MNNPISLIDLQQQADGVFSTKATADIPGFTPSKFYSQLMMIEDLSSTNSELTKLDQSLQQKLIFSPLRANYLRAFKWRAGQKVLLTGGLSTGAARYLAEQGLIIDVLEPGRELAQLIELRTRAFDRVKVFSEPLATIDFGHQIYDMIILDGLSDFVIDPVGEHDSYQQRVSNLLIKCKQALRPDGQLFLAADNRQGIKYIYGATDERVLRHYTGMIGYQNSDLKQTLNLSEWRSLLTELPFQQHQEYYLFPDYRFTSVLLSDEYCRTNPHAFQHLEGIQSKDYFQFHTAGISEILLYQAANAHGHLGDFANSCLFVIGDNLQQQMDPMDFAHFPSFNRRREYSAVVKKVTGQDSIRRTYIFPKADRQKPEVVIEDFYQGCQLSLQWRDSILSDPTGIRFQQLLLDYFSFLEKLESGVVAGINIDAIANNIIIDAKGEYHLIDREWQNLEQKIDTEFIFFRAIVHFVLRNDSIFHYFNWINHLTTLSDFLLYCFKAVGWNVCHEDLEKLRARDCDFLKTVLIQKDEYQLHEPFGVYAQATMLNPFISWRCEGEYNYSRQQTLYCRAGTVEEQQRLFYRVPETHGEIAALRFFPFEGLRAPGSGYFSVQKLLITLVDESHQREILCLDNADAVNDNNIHKGVFYAKEDDTSLFLFNSNNTFLEFELPAYVPLQGEHVQVEIDFRFAPSHDYEIARKKYALVKRQVESEFRLRDEQILTLKNKLDKQTKKLKLIQDSRIWRLLEAYRDTFKISGYPEKNFFGKIYHLIKRYRASKHRLDRGLSD